MERTEAIKIIKTETVYTPEYMEALETLIPELNENTDERIRKWMVGYFTRIGKSWIHREFTCNQIIAYLEKQKEASKAIEAVERIDKYIDEHLANAHDMKDSDPDKKYYRGWDDALGKMSGILQDVYSDEKQKDHFRDDTKMVEQKTAWSEEDEKMIKEIHGFLYEASCGIYRSYEKERFNRWESWLKSIRPQSKIQYWTEEEIEPIISDYLTGKEHYGGMIARLKCLKPKSSWKPSEEELVALKRVGSILRDYGHSELAKTVFMIEGKLANLVVLNKSIWKPSEKQMGALSWMLENARGNIDFDPLKDLYIQLKKLM